MRFLQHNPHTNLRKLSFMSITIASLMGSKQFLKTTIPFAFVPRTPSSFSHRHLFHTSKRTLPSISSKLISNDHPLSLKTNGLSYTSHANVPTPVYSLEEEEKRRYMGRLLILKRNLEEFGIHSHHCLPGQNNSMICPMCKSGRSKEKSLSLYISHDGGSALWKCFRGKRGWKGGTRASTDSRSLYASLNQSAKAKTKRELTEEGLALEPLCDQICDYFAARMISVETLRRNGVMQKRCGPCGDEIAIAFTYWRKGVLVNCKYRGLPKKFWQEKDTEKVLYGLDDVEGANDIIIVEGEIDKLAMEEAGFRNCVSVPDGAPPSVSTKDLPSEGQGKKDSRHK